MYKLLKELWNGELIPSEHRTANPELKEARDFILKSRKTLRDSLNDSQNNLLETYEKRCDEASILQNEDNFILGFCLGMKMCFEVFSSNSDD